MLSDAVETLFDTQLKKQLALILRAIVAHFKPYMCFVSSAALLGECTNLRLRNYQAVAHRCLIVHED